jgi:hypothetical protein
MNSEQTNFWTLKRRFLCGGLVLYFLVLLIPHWSPQIGTTGSYSFFILSIPFFVITLFIIGIMGITNALIEKIKGRQISSKDQFRIVLLILSAVSIIVVLLVGRLISGGLPPGSGILKFDRRLWLAETSVKTRQGITDRQRMLKSIVEVILPGKTKKEIESNLGPTLNTKYFKSTGRDLIYHTGSERSGVMRLDSEWLLIWLDDRDVFQKYKVAND